MSELHIQLPSYPVMAHLQAQGYKVNVPHQRPRQRQTETHCGGIYGLNSPIIFPNSFLSAYVYLLHERGIILYVLGFVALYQRRELMLRVIVSICALLQNKMV